MFAGGCVRWLVDRQRAATGDAEFSPGMLMASGLIAGGAIAGVIQSVIAYLDADARFDVSSWTASLSAFGGVWPMVPFVAMAVALYVIGRRRD